MTAQTRKTPVQFFVVMALALVGVGISVYLSQHFYEVRAGAAGFKSFCNVSEKINCDAVAASRYAEVFAGIPLSALGTGWLLGIILTAAFGMSAAWRRVASRALIAMSAFGVFTSLAYLVIMMGVLHTYCLFCLILDAVNLAILGVALTLKSSAQAPSESEQEDRSALKTIVGSVAVSLFVAVVATKGMELSETKGTDVEMITQEVLNSAPLPASADDRFPSVGPKNAPVTIVEFSDFQCPYCRMAALQLNTLLNRYPNKVRLVFRNFPLDPSCNASMKHAGHPVACESARVAYCANQQGKFKEVYEAIFENQASLAPGKPLELAKKAGVDMTKMEACIKAPETQTAIQTDIEEALRLKIQSTPTLFINGHKAEGGLPLPVWDKVLEKLAP